MSINIQLENGRPSEGWDERQVLNVGRITKIPFDVGTSLTGMVATLEVRATQDAAEVLYSLTADIPNECAISSANDSLLLSGLTQAWVTWDVTYNSNLYSVKQGYITVNPVGTGQLPATTTVSQLNDLIARAQENIDALNAIVNTTAGSFNFPQSFDSDPGSALTLMNDESLGRLNRVDFSLPSITLTDATPTVTEVINNINVNEFRVSCKATGGDILVSVFIQNLMQYIANPSVLSTGQIATPIPGFYPHSNNFVRVKKGLGQGKVAIEYQYQNPKTKARSRVVTEVIDLDDGRAVRDYDLLLPDCSSATMNGQFKLGDSVGLNWVFSAIEGPVEIVGYGHNPQNTVVEEVLKETLSEGELPATDVWRSKVISAKNASRVRFYATRLSGTTVTVENIKIEKIL